MPEHTFLKSVTKKDASRPDGLIRNRLIFLRTAAEILLWRAPQLLSLETENGSTLFSPIEAGLSNLLTCECLLRQKALGYRRHFRPESGDQVFRAQLEQVKMRREFFSTGPPWTRWQSLSAGCAGDGDPAHSSTRECQHDGNVLHQNRR